MAHLLVLVMVAVITGVGEGAWAMDSPDCSTHEHLWRIHHDGDQMLVCIDTEYGVKWASLLEKNHPEDGRQDGVPSGAARVNKWTWVEVQNEGVIRNENVTFRFGDTCGLEVGGYVRPLRKVGSQVLAEYTTEKTLFGTPCPSGVRFYLPVGMQLDAQTKAVDSEATIRSNYFANNGPGIVLSGWASDVGSFSGYDEGEDTGVPLWAAVIMFLCTVGMFVLLLGQRLAHKELTARPLPPQPLLSPSIDQAQLVGSLAMCVDTLERLATLSTDPVYQEEAAQAALVARETLARWETRELPHPSGFVVRDLRAYKVSYGPWKREH